MKAKNLDVPGIRLIIITGFLLILLAAMVASGTSSDPDPYEIMRRHYQAIGGKGALDKVEIWRYEGTMGFTPNSDIFRISMWEAGERFRRDIRYPGGQQLEISDGAFVWRVDTSQLIEADSTPIEQAERLLLMTDSIGEILNPESKIYALKFSGIRSADGVTAFLVLRTNILTPDSVVYYIDTSSFFMTEMHDYFDGNELITEFGDFGTIGPFVQPNFLVVTSVKDQMRTFIHIEEWDFDTVAPDSLFLSPNQRVDR